MQNKHAFTLIELLVVVLIIGILAAPPLPQYQKAVLKAKTIEGITFFDSLIKAETLYYLANGCYTFTLDNLDLDFSNYPDKVICNSYWQDCNVWIDDRIQLVWFAPTAPSSDGPGMRQCWAAGSDKLARQVCESMGTYKGQNGIYYLYNL